MKTSMQLNALVRNLSRQKDVGAEIILRNYMFERLLERIAQSDLKNNFILKGGMLIAAMVGLDARTTMDLDATIRGQDLTEAQVVKLFENILDIELDDHVSFQFKKVEEIHEEANYPGYRISFEARLDNTRQMLKVDITTGDAITPREIEYRFKLMFEDRSISILAYNLETVLAEKLESILVRGVTNTRMRDFYDIYVLTTTQSHNIDKETLKAALHNTTARRGSLPTLSKAAEVLSTVEHSSVLQGLWLQYQKNYPYAKDVSWDMATKAVKMLLDEQAIQLDALRPLRKPKKPRGDAAR